VVSNPRRRVFVVATEMPDLSGGAGVRNFYLIRELSRDYDVTVFSLADTPPDSRSPEVLDTVRAATDALTRQLPVRAITLPRRRLSPARAISAVLAQRIQPFMAEDELSGLSDAVWRSSSDPPYAVHLEQVHAYNCLASVLPRLAASGVKIVLDAHNVERAAFEATLPSFSWPKRLAGLYLRPALADMETNAVKAADLVLACSDYDRRVLAGLVPEPPPVVVIPNGVDTGALTPCRRPDSFSVLFMGGMQYGPNAEGLRWYLERVHPSVLASVAEVKLFVVGSPPPKWLIRLADTDASLRLCGWVRDIREYIGGASVCIAPIRTGSGTRLKVLEYAGGGRAVVTTSIGVEGLELFDDQGSVCAVYDQAEGFANAVVSLLRSPIEAAALGWRARAVAEARYDWSRIGARLRDCYKEMDR